MGDVRPFRRRDDADVDPPAHAPPTADASTGARPDDRAQRLVVLMGRTARGDRAAFAELYDELSPLLHGIVVRVLRNPAIGEEVTQEVFLEIWRLAPRFDGNRGSVTSWAASIAHRRAVDRVRSEQAARDREQREHALAPEPSDALADAVEERAQNDRVRRALDELTDTQRAAIELAYFGGHTYRDVAVLLGIPEGTAKTRIRDGIIRLRDHLGVTA